MLQRESGTHTESAPLRERSWRECLHEIQKGNPDALARLYDTSAPLLFTLALRILGNAADAEEVLLDTFEQVWRTARTFDPARGGVWQWLVLLTRSRALDRLRSLAGRRFREHSNVSNQPEISSPAPLPEEAIAASQQQRRVRQALSALPPEQRKALEMAYFSGLTHTEIASALGVPLGTIKTRIRMAMDKLRIALSAVPTGNSAT
ncbi:MAG TPA: sigma-70 family RNA polymerase sigma factor [Bryobacteraceae bacterium]|jgi:RNA polymerase sigma-70 factor (ECF subfamily)|nr:sigma-70 family RNA polymerase sigma factor [Bryobacteraceae bacterium]